ncbi:MAG: DNA/RNA nuclease SfsA, partial [Candidatus Lokiarchaeota archaeon]|nr:DNA/RNA nuclease SfsA [Candidatus Lokiarchaeota archaeon]
GARGWVVPAGGSKRKTSFDFVAVDHGGTVVSVDTRVPNRYVRELLGSRFIFPFSFDEVRPEFKFGDRSRIDFLATRGGDKYLIEVKSVTLVDGGTALFPDAPTSRGTRHVRELAGSLDIGYLPVIVLAIQRGDAVSFKPNARMDPDFAAAFADAVGRGVEAKAFTSRTFIAGDGSLRIEPLRFVPVGH